MAKDNTVNSPLTENKLNRSLKLIYVYAIATGAIFTFIGYWDSIFYEYCGPGTFLAFLLMTALILPIAFVYCDLAPLFPEAGGELIGYGAVPPAGATLRLEGYRTGGGQAGTGTGAGTGGGTR